MKLAGTDPDLIIRCAIATIVATLIVPAVADVDLWGHVMFGRDIVAARSLPAFDHYAFTSDLPWIDHEWLTEVLMFGAYASAGGAGLVLLRVVLLVALLAIVWHSIRRDGATDRAALTLVTLLALLSYPRTQHVRPQLFSLVAFAGLLALLKTADRGRVRALVAIPPLMAMWANLHGGFLVGLAPLGLWAAHATVDRRKSPRVRALTVAALAAAVIATLVNPYGVGLWEFLTRTVGPERGDIVEWAPMTGAGGGMLTFWLVTALLAGLAMWREGRPRSLEGTALVVFLALASFKVSRLDAFFTIATFMCLGGPLSSILGRRSRAEASAGRGRALTAFAVLAIAVAVAGYGLMRSGTPRPSCISLSAAGWLPEPEAIASMSANHLRGRLMVFFNWGEYALWHLAPGIKVSIDGRRETIYSDRHIQSHLQLYRGTSAGLSYLRELDADYVWLPGNLPVVKRLSAEGWKEIYSGERSVIFGRPGSVPLALPQRAYSSCFPGP